MKLSATSKITSCYTNRCRLIPACLLFFFLLPAANAAENDTAIVRVVTSGGFASSYQALAPTFEDESGVELHTEFGASMGGAPDSIPERLARNESFDVIILARPALNNLITAGYVVPDSAVDLAQSQIGMAVQQGAIVPDISTVDNFISTLRNANSIGFSASASGTYLSTVLWPEMGIWPELEAKSTRVQGERVAAVVARGDIEIGFQQISEILSIPGAHYVGPIPEELQLVTVFSAAIVDSANNPTGARALLDFLSSPDATAVITGQGLEPLAGAGP